MDDSEDDWEDYHPPTVSMSDGGEPENVFDSSDEKDDLGNELAYILLNGREEIHHVAAIHASRHATKAKAAAKTKATTTAASNVKRRV